MKLAGIFAILLLILTPVFGQEAEEPQANSEVIDDAYAKVEDAELVEEKEVIISSPDVVTTHVFTRYPDARLPIGKVIEILVGFQNIGQKTFNISAIHASFRFPADTAVYVQNFTAWRFGALVKPGDLRTFSYRFYPDELLEPKDYIFVGSIFYTDEDNTNFTTTFNNTIVMEEAALPVDAQTFFAYFLGLGLLALGGFAAYNYLFGGKKKRSKTVVETGTRDTGAANSEWINDSNVGTWKKTSNSRKLEKKPKNE